MRERVTSGVRARKFVCVNVISVTGLKGGSGKTSTAVPLALEAARAGRTLLLDLDETPSASQWLSAAGLEDRVPSERLDIKHLEDRVNAIEAAGEVEWLVIDTPPVRQDVVMLAAGVADLVLIPVHIGSGDVAQVAQTGRLMRLPLQARPTLIVRAVLNHTGMPAVTRETRAAVEAAGLGVLATEIPYRRTYVVAKGSAPTADWWHFGKLWGEVRALLEPGA